MVDRERAIQLGHPSYVWRAGQERRLNLVRQHVPLEGGKILDIGCGNGTPTLELARLSGGEVIGVDIDQSALDEFAGKIQAAGLGDRVKALNMYIIWHQIFSR